MASEGMKTLTAEDLAPLLHRTAETISTDARRRPHSLPPRLRIPGSRKLLWLEADVIEWIQEHREASKKGNRV